MTFPPRPAMHPVAHPEAIVMAPGVRFTVLTDRLLRLEHSRDERFEDRPSQAFWNRAQSVPAFTSTVAGRRVEIETASLRLEYHATARGFTRRTLSITLKGSGLTWRYGERPTGNLGGTARTLDGDAGSTKLEPGLLSRSGWAVVDDSRSLVFTETGWLEPRSHHTHTRDRAAPAPAKDLYFFGYGSDHAACLRDFTALAGPIPMVPRFVLGNWWSRYWAYTQDELQALMEEFRAREIPLSVCVVDMDWHVTETGNASSGWTGYTWNRNLFPDPEGFVRWLHDRGLRTALNLHPASGIHPHEEQYEQMASWMGIDPASRQPVPFDVSDPHFMKGYFEILHHPFEADGIDFWWLDWQQGASSPVPGLDPLWWLNHLHFLDHGRDGRRRPLIFSRWGGLGNHRYPIGFSGDTLVRWRTLAFQPRFTATAANVGYGWWSHDIGGHMVSDLTPELYLRWVQFGVFSPIFRLHSTNDPRLERRPWHKPEPYARAAREAMRLRHALIPYLYSMAWRAHRTGISLVTPMYYGSPREPDAFEALDQYAFGTELVVAPVVQPVERDSGVALTRVWLPPGTHYQFFTGERFEGGRWHEIRAGLADIPVFARAGAIVPLAPRPAWGGIENPTELDVHLFPGADNSFELYEDDGETTDYQRGAYAVTRFELTASGDRGGVTFTIHPATGDLSLVPARRTYRLHGRGLTEPIIVDLAAGDGWTGQIQLEP